MELVYEVGAWGPLVFIGCVVGVAAWIFYEGVKKAGDRE
jgi:cbb3-type cytochrome oxidase subunit 3